MKSMYKRLLSVILCMFILLSSLSWLTSCSKKEEDVSAPSSDETYVNLDEGFSEVAVTDEETALQAIESVAAELGITDVSKEVAVLHVNAVGEDKYYRMQQYYDGIPVYGHTIVLSANDEGKVMALTSNTLEIKNIDTTPKVDKSKIISAIKEYYNTEVFIEDITDDDLYVFCLEDTEEAKLVYSLSVFYEDNAYDVIVDANDAEILKSYSSINYLQKEFTQKGQESEQTFYATSSNGTNKLTYQSATGTKLNVFEPNQNEKYTWYNDGASTLIEWNDGEEPDKSAVDAMTNITLSYNFFKEILGIDSYDGKKSDINVYVHVAGYRGYDNKDREKVNNAFHWVSPNGTVFAFTKVYDDNGTELNEYSANLDIVAHEYTHGIENNISGMTYEGESGAIMEAYSDIFGEIVEDYADGELNNNCNWSIVDRNIANPTEKKNEVCYYLLNGKKCPFYEKHGTHYVDEDTYKVSEKSCVVLQAYPDKYLGEYFVSTKNVLNEDNVSLNDNGGVHTNNTVLSHAAYLMANGINGTAQKKIGTDQLAELWYRGLLMLQSDATFKQCANAIIVAAQQMFSDDAEAFTAAKLNCVKEAFAQVGITANETGAVWLANGGRVFAVDAIHNKMYDNYHVKVERINLNTRKIELVTEADVTDDQGYLVDLEEGTYIFTVSDNAIGGSEYEYSKSIRVFKSTLRPELTTPAIGNSKIYIYTDFETKIPITDFSMETDMMITLGELGVLEPVIKPDDANEYTIKWSSSDESVATVNPTGEVGIITTRSKGVAQITAEVTSGGKTITKSANLRVASKARDTVLVLDVSGSMYGDPLDEMKKSAIQFCNDLLKDEYNNRVGIVFYDDSVSTIDLTDDLNRLIASIEAVGGGGTTNMEAGLSAARDMLTRDSKDGTIKNVVIMADGLPNRGNVSDSGSMPVGSYSGYYTSVAYANAVLDTAKALPNDYNLYSLGFFHSLYDVNKDFATALMEEITNKKDGYYQVDKAEDLQFAFGDISDEINTGSKIVINIACPVDVRVAYGGEMLSSASGSFQGVTSFGTLQLLGKNKDIKVVSLDSDKEYEVELFGTGVGKMDYSINYLDEKERLSDYRSFEAVPITNSTIIKTATNNKDKDITLNVDEDGDGEVDIIWTALSKSAGAITYEKNPPAPDPEPPVLDPEPPVEDEEPKDNNGMNVGGIALMAILAVCLAGGGVALIVFAIQSATSMDGEEGEPIVPVRMPENKDTNQKSNRAHARPKQAKENKSNIEREEQSAGYIQVTNGSMSGFVAPIEDGETLYLGKDAKFVHLVLSSDYKKVSRVHCAVAFDAKAKRYYVTDCSTNGTYLIGKKRLDKSKRTTVNKSTVLILGDEDCTVLLG